MRRNAEPRGHLAQLGCHLDEDAAAVVGVAGSPREPSLFETVEEGGHCAGAEPGPFGQPASGHRAFLVEDVEAAIGGVVDPEKLRDRVVERLRGGLGGADSGDEVRDQFVSREF